MRLIRAQRQMSDLECTGRDCPDRAALDRYGIELQPARLLPRKYQLVAPRPVQILLGEARLEHTAHSRIGPPDKMALPAQRLSHPDRPGRAARMRNEFRALFGRHADEGELRSSWCEHG